MELWRRVIPMHDTVTKDIKKKKKKNQFSFSRTQRNETLAKTLLHSPLDFQSPCLDHLSHSSSQLIRLGFM
ncbi:hypothetical protein P8452_20331 [Trifolium repens]|nr:hypothetical protein P8452_20331 [Trifolium repens]